MKIPVSREILSAVQDSFGMRYHRLGISDEEALPFLIALHDADFNLPQNLNEALECFKFLVQKFI